MKLAYFPGCKIAYHVKAYGISLEAVMRKLGIKLVKLPFKCCGYPESSRNREVSVLSAIRNCALAEKYKLDIITPCKCCFGQLKHAILHYAHNPDLKQKIDDLLAKEHLYWHGRTRIDHILTFLYHTYGIDTLKHRIKNKLPSQKMVVQYGCHALRPFSVTGFDNPHAPKIFEDLLHIIGIQPIPWSKSTECCGHPIYDRNPALSLQLRQEKLISAAKTGADYICTACTHCQMQYETAAHPLPADAATDLPRPILFTRLLQLAI